MHHHVMIKLTLSFIQFCSMFHLKIYMLRRSTHVIFNGEKIEAIVQGGEATVQGGIGYNTVS